MAYNYLRQPVMGYQGGGKAGGGWGHWHDDVEFDEDAYGGGMRTGFTGYQGGGAVPPMQPLDIRREGDRMLDVSNLMPYHRGWGGPVRHAASPGGFTERLGFNINDYIASAEKSQGYGDDKINELMAFNKIKELLGNTLGREATVQTGVDAGPPAGKVKFYLPYPPAQPAQGFQRGGRVGKALARVGAGTAGLKSNLALEDAMEALTAAKDKASGWWDTAGSWIKGLGSAAQIASNFIPGVGPFISTAVEGGVEGLGTLIADRWAPEFEVPQDIIDRQTGAAGPVIGRRNWQKLQEGYGDLSEFSRSAGRKMRAGIASSLPERYLKAKTADLMQKQMQQMQGVDGGVNIDQIPQMEVNMPQYTPPTPAFQPDLPVPYTGIRGSSQLGTPGVSIPW